MLSPFTKLKKKKSFCESTAVWWSPPCGSPWQSSMGGVVFVAKCTALAAAQAFIYKIFTQLLKSCKDWVSTLSTFHPVLNMLAKLDSKWDLETYERPHVKDVTIHHSLIRAPLQPCIPLLCRRTSQGLEWGWQTFSSSSGEAPAAAPTMATRTSRMKQNTTGRDIIISFKSDSWNLPASPRTSVKSSSFMSKLCRCLSAVRRVWPSFCLIYSLPYSFTSVISSSAVNWPPYQSSSQCCTSNLSFPAQGTPSHQL